MALIEKKNPTQRTPLPKLYFYIATGFVLYGLLQVVLDFFSTSPHTPISKLLFRVFILFVLEFYVFYRSFLGYTTK